jgi:hypothetical protein
MSTLERLRGWRAAGIISEAQCDTLSALVRKERFSLFLEINALLYLGVLSLVAGLAWTFSTHFQKLGDVFILAVLSAMFTGCLYYCFTRPPGLVLDYILYLACLVLSVELGYIEFRFEWLKDAWHNYLLFSSLVFFALAYRFDNRFVLSLALSTLAAWFGVKASRFGFMTSDQLRVSALVYSLVVIAAGAFMYQREIKKHFLDTYLHIAANVAFIALVSGVDRSNGLLFLAALILAAAASVVMGTRFRKFSFVVYGIVFGYIGISIQVLPTISHFSTILTYLVVTGSGVILLVVFLAQRFGRQE